MVAVLHCSSQGRHVLLVPQSRTTIIAQHRAYASVKVEPDITRHCFEPLSNLSDFEGNSQ